MSKLVKNPEVDKLNQRLKAANLHIAVEQRDDRLYLRGTFPPKPGSGKSKPHDQRIPLGIYANPAGIKAAWKRAIKAASDIADRQFDWSEWISQKSETPKSAADWTRAFEQDYFTRRARTPASQTTWDKDYQDVFKKLPDGVLTTEMMLELIASKPPDTRTRKRFCTALSALAKFAGVHLDAAPLRGKYSPKSVQPRILPSDEVLMHWRDQMINEEWMWAYSVIVAYGLRPHELFHLDLDSIRKSELAHVTGKTGEHWILPVMHNWWEDWRLFDVKMPQVQADSNRKYGARARYYIKRRSGMPYPLYHVRHAWAARAAREGLPDTIAARLQGHSPQIHYSVYQRFLDETHLLAAWRQSKKPDAKDDD